MSDVYFFFVRIVKYFKYCLKMFNYRIFLFPVVANERFVKNVLLNEEIRMLQKVLKCILVIKPTRSANSQIYFWNKILHHQEFRPDPARKLSAHLYDMYHYCVYSEKLLMMERGTVRNM